jgi:hypothetical protein
VCCSGISTFNSRLTRPAVGATSSREQDLIITVLEQQMARLIDCAMKPLIGQRLVIYNLFRILATKDFGIRVLQVRSFE